MEQQMLSIALRAHDIAIKRLSNSTFHSQDSALQSYLEAYNEIFKVLYAEAQNSTFGY